jgi:hypothetical protein
MGPTLPGGRKSKPSMTLLICRGPAASRVVPHQSKRRQPLIRGPPTSSSQACLNYSDPHKPAKTLLALENKQFFVSQSREGRLGNAEVF